MTGDVAQWVERLLRMQEAGGSNPPISTINSLLVIGCSYLVSLSLGERGLSCRATKNYRTMDSCWPMVMSIAKYEKGVKLWPIKSYPESGDLSYLRKL